MMRVYLLFKIYDHKIASLKVCDLCNLKLKGQSASLQHLED